MRLWEEVEYTWHAGGPEEDTHLTGVQNGVSRRYPEWLREYFNYKFMLLDVAGEFQREGVGEGGREERSNEIRKRKRRMG